MKATVYSETTIHTQGPPYQIAIVELKDGARRTVRVEGDAVAIGDLVDVDGKTASALAQPYSGSAPNHSS